MSQSTSTGKYNLGAILEDSRQLANRMRSRDENFDLFIKRGHTIKETLSEKRKHLEGSVSLQQLASSVSTRPLGTYMLCVAAENEQLEKLREENATLSRALEEHQTVMDLIMSKYRSQMTQGRYLQGKESEFVTPECPNPDEIKTDPRDSKRLVSQLPGLLSGENSNGSSGLTSLGKSELNDLVHALYQRIHTLSSLSQESINASIVMSQQMESRIHQLEMENANLKQLLQINTAVSKGELTGSYCPPTSVNLLRPLHLHHKTHNNVGPPGNSSAGDMEGHQDSNSTTNSGGQNHQQRLWSTSRDAALVQMNVENNVPFSNLMPRKLGQ